MQRGDVDIVLERRTGRQLMGCLLVGIAITALFCIGIKPEEYLTFLIVFGIVFAVILLAMRDIRKCNIILSTQGIRFIHDAQGMLKRNKPVEIPWNELGEVKHLSKVWRNEQGREIYNILELNKKGDSQPDKPFIIHYCNNLGRQVLNSQTSFTAERAVALIEKLRDAGSGEERIQILKNTYVGKSPGEIKRQVRNTPWKQRLTKYCPACKGIIIVDGRKEQSEQKCHSCGSNEIYKDEDEYLKTLDKKA